MMRIFGLCLVTLVWRQRLCCAWKHLVIILSVIATLSPLSNDSILPPLWKNFFTLRLILPTLSWFHLLFSIGLIINLMSLDARRPLSWLGLHVLARRATRDLFIPVIIIS